MRKRISALLLLRLRLPLLLDRKLNYRPVESAQSVRPVIVGLLRKGATTIARAAWAAKS